MALELGVAAAAEKYLEKVQPPRETRILSLGYLAFNSRS